MSNKESKKRVIVVGRTTYGCEYCKTMYDTQSEALTCDCVNQTEKEPTTESTVEPDELSDEYNEPSKKKKRSSSVALRTHLWTRTEEFNLIQLIQKHQNELNDKSTMKKAVWKQIFEELKYVCGDSLGNEISDVSVQRKWRNLMASYRRFYDLEKSKTNSRTKKPEFYEEIHELLKGRKYPNAKIVKSEVQQEIERDAHSNSETDSCSTILAPGNTDDPLLTSTPADIDEDEEEVAVMANGSRVREDPSRTTGMQQSISEIVNILARSNEIEDEKLNVTKESLSKAKIFRDKLIKCLSENNSQKTEFSCSLNELNRKIDILENTVTNLVKNQNLLELKIFQKLDEIDKKISSNNNTQKNL